MERAKSRSELMHQGALLTCLVVDFGYSKGVFQRAAGRIINRETLDESHAPATPTPYSIRYKVQLLTTGLFTLVGV